MDASKRSLRIHVKKMDEKIPVRLISEAGVSSKLYAYNVSRSGLFLAGESALEPGAKVELEIGSADSLSIHANGRVVWNRPESENAGLPGGIGVALVNLEKGSKPQWHKLLMRCLNQVTADDLMEAIFLRALGSDDVGAVVSRMQAADKDVVVVSDGAKNTLITSKDLLLALGKGKAKRVGDIAGGKTPQVPAKASPSKLFEELRHSNASHAMVIGLDNQVVGLINTSVVLPYLAEFLDLERSRLEAGVLLSTARIVHDLRTPLGIISTSNQTLLSGQIGAEEFVQNGLSAIIDESCSFIDGLLNDLLMISSDNLEKDALTLEPFNMVDACQRALNSLRPIASAKKQLLTFSCQDANVPLSMDRLKMTRILNNLVTNAMKYSPPGSEITVTLVNKADGVELSCADQGLGIAADKLANIFEEFNRGAIGSEVFGYGLGLAIVHRIVKACGGKITVESAENKGSTFRVTFPK